MPYNIKKYIMAEMMQNTSFQKIYGKSCIIRYSYYLISMPRTLMHLFWYGHVSPFLDKILCKHKFEEELSAVLIIKDEAAYIEEWIEFHRIIGFTKFYIFDNGSSDNLCEVISPYIEKGIVEYIFFPGIGMQGRAYTYASRKYRWKTKYMMMFDTDEFVYPVQDDKLIDIIDELFMTHNNVGGIGINLRWFGNSGYEKKPQGMVTESYIHRACDEWNDNKASSIIKTVCNPRKVFLFELPTHPIYCKGNICINEEGMVVEGAWSQSPSFNKLRINHYWAKSKEEYVEKQKRGNVNTGAVGDKTWELYEKYNRNEKEDKSIIVKWEGSAWWSEKHNNWRNEDEKNISSI